MHDALIDQVAWIGQKYVRGDIRGIVLRFSGLNTTAMKNGADPLELAWGDAGGLVVTPYHAPWAWMNPGTRDFVDELIDAIIQRYNLEPTIPIIATGESMGGYGALVFTLYSRHRITACWCNSPPCDLPAHYAERGDLPRTMHHAFGSYDDIKEVLILHSPLHQVAKMPRIPYFIVHGPKDKSVSKVKHSDPMVAAMGQQGLDITYIEPPEMEHCGPLTWPVWCAMKDFVVRALGGLGSSSLPSS